MGSSISWAPEQVTFTHKMLEGFPPNVQTSFHASTSPLPVIFRPALLSPGTRRSWSSREGDLMNSGRVKEQRCGTAVRGCQSALAVATGLTDKTHTHTQTGEQCADRKKVVLHSDGTRRFHAQCFRLCRRFFLCELLGLFVAAIKVKNTPARFN